MPPNTTPVNDQFTQLLTSLEEATNVLVTVSANPTVDQLAAAIGLTVALNKKGKHGTAVFSGKVPSTLEFLQPERTIERNTDSLQDFIISLDKAKADKLRYKIEDDFVKIFITPYRSSVSESDLNFSLGDFNIDLVITIGVQERGHLDEAIIAHGRILHDATVASITTDTISELGSINWFNHDASCLCEMVTDLVNAFGKDVIDSQIATALLTGMVAETDRFGNEKARPHTMQLSGMLMSAGASTQLISSKLQAPEPTPDVEEPSDEIPEVVEEPAKAEAEEPQEPEAPEPPKDDNGTITIEHQDDNIHIDEHGTLRAKEELEAHQAELAAKQQAEAAEQADQAAEAALPVPAPVELPPQPPLPPVLEQPLQAPSLADGRSIMREPPQLGGRLTANSMTEEDQYSQQEQTVAEEPAPPMLEHTPELAEAVQAPEPVQTLSDLEKAVNSPHIEEAAPFASDPAPVAEPLSVDDARAAVDQVLASSDTYRPEPISALNATTIELTADDNQPIAEKPEEPQDSGTPPPPPVPPPMPSSTFNV